MLEPRAFAKLSASHERGLDASSGDCDILALDSVIVDGNKADDATRGAVTGHGPFDCCLDEVDAFTPGHAFTVDVINVTIYVGGARTADGKGYFDAGSTEGYNKHLTTVVWVVAGDDNASKEHVLVFVAYALAQIRSRRYKRRPVALYCMRTQVMSHVVGHSLRIGS